MTVEELIKQLEQLPPDLKVYRYEDFWWSPVGSAQVQKGNVREGEWVEVL